MALPVFDAASNASNEESNSLTWAHVTSGTNRVLVVSAGSGTATVNSVTYGGVAMTAVGAQVGDVRQFYQINPGIGSNNVVVSYGGGTFNGGGAVSFTDADQTTPVDDFAGTASGNSVTLTATTDCIAVDCAYFDGEGSSWTVGAGQTSRWNVLINGIPWAGSTEPKTGAGSITMSHSGNTGSYHAVAIKGISGGDTTAPILTTPTGTKTGETTASGTVTTDEANGTLDYLVDQNATRTAAQIIAGTTNQAVSSTGVQNVSLTGLTGSTTYYLHYVHTDAASNESNVVNSSSFTTDAPSNNITITTVAGAVTYAGVVPTVSIVDTGPLFHTPAIAAITDTSADVKFWVNEACTSSYLYMSASATPPSVANHKTGTGSLRWGSLGALPANQLLTIAVTLLTPGTQYYSYMMGVDAAANDSNQLAFSPFTTTSTSVTIATVAGAVTYTGQVPVATVADVNPAILTLPTGTATGVTSADATVTTNEGTGSLFYMVNTSPTATLGDIFGSTLFQPVTVSGVQNVNFTGLTGSTNYYAHFTQQDGGSNLSVIVNSSVFTTSAAAALRNKCISSMHFRKIWQPTAMGED
jgi:hypothetical protein